jgi:hypothetical protein
MAQRGAPDDRDSLPNPPSVVHVTVEAGPSARGLRALLVLGLVVAGAALGGVLLVTGSGGAAKRGPASTRTVQAGPRLRGTAQVAAVTEAYRFPLGCMGMTLSHRALADALTSRTGPCWRYGVFVTAVLRQVDGVWQLGLEATSRSCPRIALPASIRAELAVCRR